MPLKFSDSQTVLETYLLDFSLLETKFNEYYSGIQQKKNIFQKLLLSKIKHKTYIKRWIKLLKLASTFDERRLSSSKILSETFECILSIFDIKISVIFNVEYLKNEIKNQNIFPSSIPISHFLNKNIDWRYTDKLYPHPKKDPLIVLQHSTYSKYRSILIDGNHRLAHHLKDKKSTVDIVEYSFKNNYPSELFILNFDNLFFIFYNELLEISTTNMLPKDTFVNDFSFFKTLKYLENLYSHCVSVRQSDCQKK